MDKVFIKNLKVEAIIGIYEWERQVKQVISLDIEMDEIQNELQRKMVEEIQCVMCFQFPFKPLECKSCNKLFCKYCQLQLQ